MLLRWVILGALALCASSQKIVSKPRTFTVVESSTVDLPCYIEDLAEDDSVIWKRGSEPLFVDEEKLAEDDRYSVTREGSNYTLTIKSVEPIDNSEYSCSITDPEMEVKHKIIVHSRPIVIISPDHSTYDVNVGDTNVVVKCNVKGNPTPSVKWERTDGDLPVGMTVRHQQLVISKAERGHSGEYACTAKNAAGSDSASLIIRVNEPLAEDAPLKAPWVKLKHSYVPVSKGQEITLECDYEGLPAPQSEWLFNGYKINFSEKKWENSARTAVRQTNHSTHRLIITKMEEEIFGDYMCRASNNLGTAQAVMHVSGRPGPPKISVDESNLSWKVRAVEPILEYRVYFRTKGMDDWVRHESFRVSKGDHVDSDTWEHEVSLLPHIEAGVKYELQVKARNALGWGSLARDYVTVEIPQVQQESSSSSPMAVLVSLCMALLVRGI